MNNQHISTGGILMEPTESKTSRGDHLQCDICLKSFPDAALLSLHHWIHAGSSSDPPPLATVKELFEPETLIKPEEIKEELADINEQEDENTDKDKIEQNLNEDNTHQELMKCEDIKLDAVDSNTDPLMLSDQFLLDDSVSSAAGKYVEKLEFIDTRKQYTVQQHHSRKQHQHSRKVEQQIAPRPEGIRYPCDLCHYKAADKTNLLRHTTSAHKKSRYPCDQCDVAFQNKSSLYTHKAAEHKGIRYPCDQCDYAARAACHLKLHKARMHEGIRYLCDQCDYKAGDKYRLTRHKWSKH